MLKITRTQTGFVEQKENIEVERLECNYSEKTCTVFFHKRPPLILKDIECSVFNAQYGLPISNDGSQLFFSDWDTGLWAYDLKSGSIIWRSSIKHVTRMYAKSPNLIAVQQDQALICFDMQTGICQKKIGGRSISRLFVIDEENLLIDSISGRLCVVSTKDLSIRKRYNKKVVNPNGCLSIIIQQVEFRDNMLTIIGWEKYPGGVVKQGQQAEGFARIIDPKFFSEGEGSALLT